MSRLQSILERLKADLDALDVRWCLVGGLAVSVWGEPRLTRDVDVAVAVDDDRQAETLIRELRDRGYEDEELVEQESVGRLATARFCSRELPNGIVLDILFASSGIEREAWCAGGTPPHIVRDETTPSGLVQQLGADPIEDLVPHTTEHRELVILGSTRRGGVLETPVKTLRAAGKERARFVRLIADRDDIVPRRVDEPL